MNILGMRLHKPSFANGIALITVMVFCSGLMWIGYTLNFYALKTFLVLVEGGAVALIASTFGVDVVRYKWRAMLFLVMVQVVFFVVVQLFIFVLEQMING